MPISGDPSILEMFEERRRSVCRRFLGLLLPFILTVPTIAQWSESPAVNTPVCLADSVQQTPAACSDGAGGAIIAWADRRNGNFDIYAQRLSAAGIPLWTSDGVQITTDAESQVSPEIAPDGVGGAFIVWHDYRNAGSGADIYCQRIDGSGAPVWISGGFLVSGGPQSQFVPSAAGDGSGGVMVVWYDNRNAASSGYDIYAQHLNSSGTRSWPGGDSSITTAPGDQHSPVLTTDGSGGFHVAWTDQRNGTTFPDIYAQRISAGGARLWPGGDSVVVSAPGSQVWPAIAPDGSGGAYVSWSDGRSYTVSDWDLYAQRIDGTGSRLWASSGVLVTATTGRQIAPSLAPDGAGGVLAAWQNARYSTLFGHSYWSYSIVGQRLDSSGSRLWGSTGLTITSTGSAQNSVTISPDGDGGAIAAWSDARQYAAHHYDIYAQRIHAHGSLHTPTNTGWQSVFPFPSGNSLYAVHHRTENSVIAVGGGGLMLRSTDGGESWRQLYRPGGSFATFRGIAFMAGEDTGIVVGTNGTILRTIDGGSEWTRILTTIDADLYAVSFASGDTAVAVGQDGTVLVSWDAGRTWNDPGSFTTRDLTSVGFRGTNRGVAVGDTGSVFNTTDGGLSWTFRDLGNTAQNRDVHFLDSNRLWMTGDVTFWKSPDAGVTWHHITVGSPPEVGPYPKHWYSVYALNLDTLVLGSNIHFWVSRDEGATWEVDIYDREANLYDISFGTETDGLAVGFGGIIMRTTNAGSDWFEITVKKTGLYKDIHFVDGKTGWIVGNNSRVGYTTDAGRTWVSPTDPPEWFGEDPYHGGHHGYNAVQFLNGDTGWAAGDLGKIVRTYDGGSTWHDNNTGSSENQAMHFFNKDSGLVVGSGDAYPHVKPSVYRTTDAGSSWDQQESIVGTSRGSLYNLDFVDDARGWAVGDTGIWPGFTPLILQTTDNGQSWTDTSHHLRGVLGDASLRAVCFVNDDTVFLGGLKGTFPDVHPLILRTSDGGQSWTEMTHPLQEELGYIEDILFIDSRVGYAVGGSGFHNLQAFNYGTNDQGTGYLLVTTNGGATWRPQPAPASYLRRIHFAETPDAGAIGAAVGSGLVCTITLPETDLKSWTGGSTLWDEPTNWTPAGVPLKYHNVSIPPTANDPVVSGPADQVTVGSLTILSGAGLTIDDDVGHFVVKGNLVEYGDLVADENVNIIVGGSSLKYPGGPFIDPGASHGPRGPAHSRRISMPRYLLNGRGEIAGAYGRLIADAQSDLASTGDIVVAQSMQILSDMTLRSADRIVVDNPSAAALTGPGKVTGGGIERAISATAQGETYRFESEQTYVVPAATAAGITAPSSTLAIPERLTMITHAAAAPRAFSLRWKVVGNSSADSFLKRVSAAGDFRFANSKWSLGKPKASVIHPTSRHDAAAGVPAYGEPGVRRIYETAQQGGGAFSAEVSFRYAVEEVLPGVEEDSLVLLSGPYIADMLAEKWNMASIPVNPVDSAKTSLFAGASSQAFAFDPDEGYQPRSALGPGVGYWVKYPAAQEVEVGGIDVENSVIPVVEGWNLIGSLSYEMEPGAVSTFPPELLTSPFYEYTTATAIGVTGTSARAGYAVADRLKPMRGYWVKANADGQILLDANASTALRKRGSTADAGIEGFSSLTITGAEGSTATLLYGPAGEGSLRRFDLPPLPPEDAFDVRFGTNRRVEWISGSETRSVPIHIRGAAYPITIAWRTVVDGPAATLRSPAGEAPLAGRGSVRIEEPGPVSLLLDPGRTVEGTPAEFALRQNYPNPFNPRTTISFELPVDARVQLAVYSVLGERVAVLIDEIRRAGRWGIDWEAGALASGVYFYRFDAEGPNGRFTAVRKMILLK